MTVKQLIYNILCIYIYIICIRPCTLLESLGSGEDNSQYLSAWMDIADIVAGTAT